MQAKHPLWGNGTTLPETCHLAIFEHITHQNDGNHGKHSRWENKKKNNRNNLNGET